MAENFFDRLKGLMFSRAMLGDGLLITHCNSIHTFFMKYDIDVVFLSQEFVVLEVIRELSPWRLTLPCLSARYTLELAGGTLSSNISKGDTLEVINV